MQSSYLLSAVDDKPSATGGQVEGGLGWGAHRGEGLRRLVAGGRVSGGLLAGRVTVCCVLLGAREGHMREMSGLLGDKKYENRRDSPVGSRLTTVLE